MQSRKWFQVLFVAVLCTVLFAVIASAKDREDGRANPGAKAPHQKIVIQNQNGQQVGPVGHWTPIQRFNQTVPSPFGKAVDSCSGSCNCGTCGCYGTYDCCAAGCGACFAVACGYI
jgi:hypothetical protein